MQPFLAKRRTRVVAALVLAVVAGALWWHWYRPLEAHYRGRPSSWWAREFRQWESGGWGSFGPGPVVHRYYRRPTRLEGWLDRLGVRIRSCPDDECPLVNPDAAAVPVLTELLAHPDVEVRSRAVSGLEGLEPEECRPALSQLLKVAEQDGNVFALLVAARINEQAAPEVGPRRGQMSDP